MRLEILHGPTAWGTPFATQWRMKRFIMVVTLALLPACGRKPSADKQSVLAKPAHQTPTRISGVVGALSASIPVEERVRLEGRWRNVLQHGWVGKDADFMRSTPDPIEDYPDVGDDPLVDEWAADASEPESATRELLSSDDEVPTDDFLMADHAAWSMEIDALHTRVESLESRMVELEGLNQALTVKLLLHSERLAFFQTAIAVGLLPSPVR